MIDALFDAALDKPPAERRAYLETEAPDESIRLAVERLLAAGETTIGNPWDGELGQAMAQDLRLDPAQNGERIGTYEVVRELGRGGMASVYLAKRADGHFDQQVALKLATTVAPDQAEVLRRFHLERQILASLDHPHIARLVDGGLTGDGRPFFAMELVDGTPIDRFCDDGRLPVRDRLRLMIDAARAVEAAHRALVVHRDIKPSNVLVTKTGLVKLLDFGIAKSLADQDGLDVTRTAASMMTPEYASPEQFLGELVTTSSDVYQLGLLLYQLLTGERPYSLVGLAPTQAQRLVCETSPDRPSTRLTRLTGPETLENISALRGVRPAELRRQLSGDLDTIVMKALRKEPDRRYRSAAELADDLENYLEGRPIRARGDSPLYLAGTFLKRHAAAAAGVAVALLTLVGLSTFYTVQLGQERNAARLEAKAAAEARDEAQAARLEAEETTEFLVDLFEQSNPWETSGGASGEDLTARELLELGAQKIRAELSSQPLTQARLMGTIGDVYRRLSLYDEAEGLLQEAFAIRQQHLDADSLDMADSYYRLGYLNYDRAAFDQAEELFRQATEILEKNLGPDSHKLALVLNGQATVARRQGDLERAEELFERVIEIEEGHYGPDHVEVAISRANLANLYDTQGRFDEAIALFEEALAVAEKSFGPEHIGLSNMLNNLANTYDNLGESEKALELQQRSLAIREKSLGSEHPLVASGLVNLGSMLQDVGQPEAARAALMRAASIIEPKAPNHPGLGNVYTNLASIALDEEDFEQTEQYFQLALEHRERTLGPEHRDVGAALYNFGELYLRMERPRDAAARIGRAIEIWRASLSEDHPYLGFGYTAAGDARRQLGDVDEALDLYERAEAILSARLPPGHEMRQRVVDGYAPLLEQRGRSEEARALRASLEAESESEDG